MIGIRSGRRLRATSALGLALLIVPAFTGAADDVATQTHWKTSFGSATPTVLGQNMLFRAAGNRYGLPNFYERHAWLWQGNPLGLYNDWNPDISCLGNGDNGG